MSDPDIIVDFTALLLDTLGFTEHEFVSIGHDVDGQFHTAVGTPAGAGNFVSGLPDGANVYFGVNPVRGPARQGKGRGTAEDVTRLGALYADLDVKPGACQSPTVAEAIIDELSGMLGTRPSAITHSGGGLHPYWPVAEGTPGSAALLRRWGRLVAVVAESRDARVDSVFDLARMLRVPGTSNNKTKTNGHGGSRVVTYGDTGAPLSIAEIDERLNEFGVPEEDEPHSTAEQVSNPADWGLADDTCNYVTELIDGIPSDGPLIGKGRHQWVLKQTVRLACAVRLGCVSQTDWRRAQKLLDKRLRELRAATGEKVPHYEVPAAMRFGIERAATKTDEQAWAELGDHEHTAVSDDYETGSGAKDSTNDTASATWTFVDGASFILDIPPTIPACWGEGNDVAWAEGESLMVAGPMGLGKTTLAGLLLRAQLGVGDGLVLGLNVAPRSGKILYLAMDRPAQIARALARQFTEAERKVLTERLTIWRGPPPADIAKNPALLARLAEAAGAETVYLDSVKDAAVGLSEDEVGAGYNRARQHLLARGVQLCEQHHTTKRGAGGGPPTSVADVYGSAWITNGTGSIVLLAGDPGDPIVGFRHVRAPAEEVGPFRCCTTRRPVS